MNNLSPLGLALMALGALLLGLGLYLYLGGTMGWLGKLPGDIRVEREHLKFYLPITTSIIISLILTALMFLFSRLGR